jgi:hypothetical protein
MAKKIMHCSIALFALGCIYAIAIGVPVYKLDWLSILIVTFVAVGVLVNVWRLSQQDENKEVKNG